MMKHFMFHIHCIFVHKLFYFIFFSAYFCVTFLPSGIATSISIVLLLLLLLLLLFLLTCRWCSELCICCSLRQSSVKCVSESWCGVFQKFMPVDREMKATHFIRLTKFVTRYAEDLILWFIRKFA
jgi:hypothetical protein